MKIMLKSNMRLALYSLVFSAIVNVSFGQIISGGGGSGGTVIQTITNVPAAYIGDLYVTNFFQRNFVTNYAYASSLVLDASFGSQAEMTNAASGNISLLVTNTAPGASGTFRILSDGSARTINVFSDKTQTLLATNTVTGYGGTNMTTTASKHLYYRWDVRRVSPVATNIFWWAISQP